MPFWIGRPLALIAVGAILAFAVHVYVPYVDVPTAGLALLLVGLLDLGVSLWFATASRQRRQRRRTASRLVGWLSGADDRAKWDEALAETRTWDPDATEVIRRRREWR